jgi:hypothetical protein
MMNKYLLGHLSDPVLIRELAEFAGHERNATAGFLARIAEVDERRLYRAAGYSYMHAYCVAELRLSEDAAYKRIQAARIARRFPVLFEALADGRIHLSGICLLAPHLIEANAQGLIHAATHRTKAQIEELLADRFARTECMPMVEVLPAAHRSEYSLAPGQVETPIRPATVASPPSLAPGQVERALPRAQSVHGGDRVRSRVHGTQTPAGPRATRSAGSTAVRESLAARSREPGIARRRLPRCDERPCDTGCPTALRAIIMRPSLPARTNSSR